ncbi:MAG: hypothetical protein ISS15_21265 [Alphaproteobacteria bacterium]|nr:hypothetical protein [Reyranella sp.]MBL6940110.1 hypothetical protein [Alphaproteobacteria bacterium]MBL7100197.1 hypothetical protein [Alphaproteobacteria bacterium]
MLKAILRRLAVAILGVAVLTATTPSFAAMECCDHMKRGAMSETQVSDMQAMPDMTSMNGMTHQSDADQGNEMPCKMPASACVSACAPMMAASMTGIAFPSSEIAGKLSPGIAAPLSGIARPPDLEPPILSA